MEMLAKYIRMRTARSAATASHPCVERPTEGINQYREQSLKKIFRCCFFTISVLSISIEKCYIIHKDNLSHFNAGKFFQKTEGVK
ncbi:MAG: hypothetical protein E7057_05905 [Lentisphaerae bacterium]|nr:hypothetical protein [Lentisphaerota bacterium]